MNIGIEHYAGGNSNAHKVQVGNKTIWFSYTIVIAVRLGPDLYVSENVWSQTTGKHLNAIDSDKSIRIPNDDFNRMVNGLI